jgi:hypothetical protein
MRSLSSHSEIDTAHCESWKCVATNLVSEGQQLLLRFLDKGPIHALEKAADGVSVLRSLYAARAVDDTPANHTAQPLAIRRYDGGVSWQLYNLQDETQDTCKPYSAASCYQAIRMLSGDTTECHGIYQAILIEECHGIYAIFRMRQNFLKMEECHGNCTTFRMRHRAWSPFHKCRLTRQL